MVLTSVTSLPLIFKEKVNLKKIITNAAANKIEFRDWWKQGLHKFPAFEVLDPALKILKLSQRIINVFYPDMELDDSIRFAMNYIDMINKYTYFLTLTKIL